MTAARAPAGTFCAMPAGTLPYASLSAACTCWRLTHYWTIWRLPIFYHFHTKNKRWQDLLIIPTSTTAFFCGSDAVGASCHVVRFHLDLLAGKPFFTQKLPGINRQLSSISGLCCISPPSSITAHAVPSTKRERGVKAASRAENISALFALSRVFGVFLPCCEKRSMPRVA